MWGTVKYCNCHRNGHRLYMFSSSRPHILNIRTVAHATSSSAMLTGARAKTAVTYVVFLIKVMRTPPETFVSMQKCAGEMKLLKPQMQQRTWMLQGKY